MFRWLTSTEGSVPRLLRCLIVAMYTAIGIVALFELGAFYLFIIDPLIAQETVVAAIPFPLSQPANSIEEAQVPYGTPDSIQTYEVHAGQVVFITKSVCRPEALWADFHRTAYNLQSGQIIDIPEAAMGVRPSGCYVVNTRTSIPKMPPGDYVLKTSVTWTFNPFKNVSYFYPNVWFKVVQ